MLQLMHYEKASGEHKWVALSSDYKKLLAVGDRLIDVLVKTNQKDKVVMKVLPNLGYAPHSSK